MPSIDVSGYKIGFYAEDIQSGEPIHVHVYKNGLDAKFWMEDPIRLAYNRGYKNSDLNKIERIVEDNRQEIFELWNEWKGKIR